MNDNAIFSLLESWQISNLITFHLINFCNPIKNCDLKQRGISNKDQLTRFSIFEEPKRFPKETFDTLRF